MENTIFGLTEGQIAQFGLTFGVGAFILYMLFIIGNLARQSKAGKYGTIWMFVALGLGFVGFVAWLFGRELGEDKILEETIGSDPSIAPSFVELWKDVVAEAFAQLTPTVWIPCFIAMAIGGILLVASLFIPEPRRRPAR